MVKKLKKLNNQGSTLLTIIICLAFIGILGAMMLTATMTNLQMKVIESQSKKNFYTCEMAMEEIRTGIQELAADAVKTVYEDDILSNYAAYINMSENDKNAVIQNMVAHVLVQTLSGESIPNEEDIFSRTDIKTQNSVLNIYLSKPEAVLTDAAITSVKAVNEDRDSDGKTEFYGASVVLKDLKVAYNDGDYQTSITTDIRITLPKFTFEDGSEIVHSGMEEPFQDYVLVADGSINASGDSGTDEVLGNVYAGEDGINITDSMKNGGYVVNIKGSAVVTRGDITVCDSAKLTISANTAGGQTALPSVWADNLATETSSSYHSLSKTTLDINGISIIKDDLVLNGLNSEAVLSGAYVGYTGLHTKEGSAVMINGSGSGLDLSGLSPLILAGRAHVYVEDSELNKDAQIMTGESVAFKSNQRAYLVPGKFIEGILHNPVTEADIMATGTAVTPKVTILNDSVSGLNYLDAVTGAPSPYKIAAKQSGTASGASTLRYYYLNFGSGKQADAFLADYFTKYPAVFNLMSPFTLGDVKVPSSGLYCAGSVMSYDKAANSVGMQQALSASYGTDKDLDDHISALTLNESVFSGTSLEGRTVSQLSGLYSKISHLLTTDNTSKVYAEADKVVSSEVGGVTYFVDNVAAEDLRDTDFNYIKASLDLALSSIDKASYPARPYFVVIDGDASVNTNFDGVLIASGDITIADGITINGMLISTGESGSGNILAGNNEIVNGRLAAAGNISFGTNCRFEIHDSVENQYITPLFASEGEALRNLFRNLQTTVNFITMNPASSLVDLSMESIISYENWRKNKD